MEIPAGGRVGFLPFSFSADHAGTFEVRAFGASTQVEVTNLSYETPVQQPSIPSAYSTNAVYRIGGVNLTDITLRAQSAGYEIISQDYIREWQPSEGTIHASALVTLSASRGRGIELDYDKYANITHVRFALPADANETFTPLWGRLSRYMHRDVPNLNETKWDAESGFYWMSFATSGEPDWDEVRADMGGLVERHTRWVGQVFEYYDSDSRLGFMTGFTIVEEEKTLRVGSTDLRVVLRLKIDEEGDFSLEVFESEAVKLADPGSLFVPMFEALSLSASSLDGLVFDESWWIANKGIYP